MRDAVQQILDESRAALDSRVTVFDLQIEILDDQYLSLSGRLLSEEQLSRLRAVFSERLPALRLDTSAVRVLHHPGNPVRHVATSVTGLHEKPTFRVPMLDELYFGTPLEILEEAGKWTFVRRADGYLGWAYRAYLADGTAAPATHLVIGPSAALHAERDPRSPICTRLVSGTGVRVDEIRRDWAWVVANQCGWLPIEVLRNVDDFPKTAEQRRLAIVEDSARMIGTPYLWGGSSSNGIDCSGLARLLHRWIGIEIPRDADMQCDAARPVEPPFEVGDLFFFAEDDPKKISHVGISLGGSKLIHSSRTRNGVYVDDLQKSESLREIYVSAGSFLR